MPQSADDPTAREQALSRGDDTPDIEQRAAQQGVRPVARFQDLLGDFRPEDESVDDFIAAVRSWRRCEA
jgi:hypothetical protein